MKILNWTHPSDFLKLIESLSISGEEHETVVQLGRHSHASWYHIAMIATMFPRQQLIFICRDQRIRLLLKQYGFTSYTSLQRIQDILPEGADILHENLGPIDYIRFCSSRWFHRSFSWVKGKTSKKKLDVFTVRHSSWYVLLLGIVVVLLLIIGIVSLTSPHATIMISPQVTLQNAIGNIVFMSEDSITADTQVPLRKQISPFEIQRIYTITTYDTTKVHRAKGKIKIINTRSESFNLKPQTRVAFEDIIYRTQGWLEIPAAQDSAPGEVIIGVTADVMMSTGDFAGIKGNILAGTQLTFPGLEPQVHEGISVVSIENFTGGEDGFFPLLTENEKKRIESQFRDYFITAARDSIEKSFNANADFIPLPLSAAVIPFQIDIQSDQEVGSTAAEITFTGKGEFLMYLYDKNNLRKILIKLAQSHLLRGVESFTDTFKPPVIVSVLSQSKEPDPFSIKATAQIEIQVLYDFQSTAGKKTVQNILSDLLSAEKDRVEKTLLNHPYIKDVHIRLTPFWSRKLPSTLDAIDIQVVK